MFSPIASYRENTLNGQVRPARGRKWSRAEACRGGLPQVRAGVWAGVLDLSGV